MAKTWTANDIETLKALWLEGVPSTLIGKQLGCSRDAVTGKARLHGLPKRPNPVPDKRAAFAEALSIHGNIEQAGKDAELRRFGRAQEMFGKVCSDVGAQALGNWHVKWPA